MNKCKASFLKKKNHLTTANKSTDHTGPLSIHDSFALNLSFIEKLLLLVIVEYVLKCSLFSLSQWHFRKYIVKQLIEIMSQYYQQL